MDFYIQILLLNYFIDVFHINILVASIDNNSNQLFIFNIGSNSIINDTSLFIEEESEIGFSDGTNTTT